MTLASRLKLLRMSQLRINMASGVVCSLVGAAMTAFTYPLYLRYLGYEGYGLWLVLSTIVTFSQMGNLGIAQAVTKQVAEAYGGSDFKAVGECITNGIALLLLLGLAVVLLLLLGRQQIVIAMHLSAPNAALALMLIPLIALLSAYVFLVDATNAVIAGIGRMDICNYTQMGSQLIANIVGIGLLYKGKGLLGLLGANAASYLLLHLTSIYALRRMLRRPLFAISFLSKARSRHLLTFGLGLTGGGLLAMALNPINKLLLARYASLSAIPIYDLSFTGCMRIRNLFDSSQRALMPEVSRLVAQARGDVFIHARLIARRSLKMIMFAMPAYAILIAVTPLVLKLWLGSKFDPSSPLTVRVMLAGTAAGLLSLPAYYVLIALGRTKSIFAASFLQLAVNVGLIATALLCHLEVSAALVSASTSVGMVCASAYLMLRFRAVTASRERGEDSSEANSRAQLLKVH